MNTPPFTKEEFVTELLRFRDLFGQKSFWARPSVDRQAAIGGLTFIYFNLDPSVDTEPIAVSLKAALYEYILREGLMMTHGMVVGL